MKLVCPICGSDDLVRDAAARFNPETAQWELSDVYDDVTCDQCELEIDPVKDSEYLSSQAAARSSK